MISLFPTDSAQALRVKRQLMADLFILICWFVAWVAYQTGLLYMSGQAFLILIGSNVFLFTCIFLLIRFGWNRRFADPSLTVVQICIANIYTTIMMSYTQELRGGFLFVYSMAILFGVFQLNRIGFFLVSACAVGGYAVVVILDVLSPPPNFNLTLNIVLLVILAVSLAWLSFIGSYMKAMREKLKKSKLALERNNLEITRQRDSIQQAHRDLEQANRDLRRSLNERKLAEEKLIESEKMAAMGGLVAGVAHEINTPLGVAIVAASYLDEKARACTEDYRRGNMTKSGFETFLGAVDETARMLNDNLSVVADLIHHFKEVAVDQSGEEIQRFRLKKYIDDLVFSMTPTLRQGHHRIAVDCPETLEMQSYPGAIGQVLENLVLNSLIHGFGDREKGVISVLVKQEGDGVIIYYTDNGRGMEQETLDRLFEPFFTTNRSAGGTGLGMHILYNLVTRLLQGSMECTSTPDKGVVFVIKIPIRARAEQDAGIDSRR